MFQLLHNVKPHTSILNQRKLQYLSWVVLMPPTYSLDLASRDFYLFLPIDFKCLKNKNRKTTYCTFPIKCGVIFYDSPFSHASPAPLNNLHFLLRKNCKNMQIDTLPSPHIFTHTFTKAFAFSQAYRQFSIATPIAHTYT